MTLNKYLKFIVPLFAITVAAGVGLFFKNYRTSETPRHWLADLQYSHLSLSENMSAGNGSVFTPKSYNLDPIGGGEHQTLDGLADARFPLLNFVVSIFSNQIDSQIQVWRLFSFLFYLLAVGLLVLLLFELSKSWLLSLFAALGFCLTSVLFAALHTVGPYTFTYSLIILSVYALVRFDRYKNLKAFYLAICSSGIAMLQGHGTIIFFLGLLLYASSQFKHFRHNKSFVYRSLGLVLLFLLLYLYQRVVLMTLNGGLFELENIVQSNLSLFFKSLTTYALYNLYEACNAVIGVTLFSGALVFLYFKYARKDSSLALGGIGWYMIFISISTLLYQVFYVTGLVDFDLYALEQITPSLVIVSAFTISFVYLKVELNKVYVFVGLMVTSVVSFFSTVSIYENRFIETEENRVQNSLDNLETSAIFLDSLGISRSERLSYINAYGNNIAPLKTGRPGYVSIGIKKRDFISLLNHNDSKYVLSQDQYFVYDVVNEYPEVLRKLSLVATNDTVSLYKKRELKKSGKIDVLKDYASCHNLTSYHQFSNDFEQNYDSTELGHWNVMQQRAVGKGVNETACLEINETNVFPCTFELDLKKFKEMPTAIVVTAMLYTDEELAKVCFNLSCNRNGEQYYDEIFKVSKKLKGKNLKRWVRVSCKLTLPKSRLAKNDIIKLFVWNPNEGKFKLDDFSFMCY